MVEVREKATTSASDANHGVDQLGETGPL